MHGKTKKMPNALFLNALYPQNRLDFSPEGAFRATLAGPSLLWCPPRGSKISTFYSPSSPFCGRLRVLSLIQSKILFLNRGFAVSQDDSGPRLVQSFFS